MNLSKYSTVVFDCDGVILNSNKIKTNAFYFAALDFDEGAARELVDYHVSNGGVSRYKKFDYFLKVILPKYVRKDTVGAQVDFETKLEALLESYGKIVARELMRCEIAEGLDQLRKEHGESKWLVASGGDQAELRSLFSSRGIAQYFDSGIYGSPDSKETILKREASVGNIIYPAIFFGDSKYDYEAASFAGMDFVYISGWSEWFPERAWLEEKGVVSFQHLKELLNEQP